MPSRNVRIALLVIFKEMSPPDIAAKYNINLSRVYQITQTIKARYGWYDGMHPNEFSRRIAAQAACHRHHFVAQWQLDTPAAMHYEIVREEMAQDRNWHYEG